MKSTEGIIYVEVPHQSPVKAYGFGTQEEFGEWLRQFAPAGFSYATYTKEEWIERNQDSMDDEGWVAQWHQPGMDLFEKGAERIVEVWYNESNQELFDAGSAPDEMSCALRARDDFHVQYVLNHEQALNVINGNGTGHQGLAVRRAVRQEAEMLGWIEDLAAATE